MGNFPNKETQFSTINQPEHNGRPKGSIDLKTRLNKYLAIKDDNGLTKYDKIILKWLEKAEEGDNAALKEMNDRLYGKSPQTIAQLNFNTDFTDKTKEEIKEIMEKINNGIE